MTPPPVVLETNLPGLTLVSRGKVRDIYAVEDKLLIVATDRISAFDVVLPTGIPWKGHVLTALTKFWLESLADVTANHMIATDVEAMGAEVARHARVLRGRSMLVRKAKVMPVECVVRGYLAGSGWKEYQEKGSICGVALPAGLADSAELPRPIFTPTTKATSGHDQSITMEEVCGLVGRQIAEELRNRSLAVYNRARKFASGRGIIICDTKFEWGVADGSLMLIDEVLTPDSSRFWPAEGYASGRPQPSYDKQFVRDYLTRIGWNKEPPAPELPAEIVRKTSRKYLEACARLTGRRLEE